jgi:hypothetical protein
MNLQDKTTKKAHENFAFRLKMGDYEVEINGTYEDVLNTIKDLPNLVGSIDKAFEKLLLSNTRKYRPQRNWMRQS